MSDPDFDPYLPPRAPVGKLRTKAAGTDAVEGNPWLTVWTRPRGTIRAIVDTDPSRSVILLSALSGITSTFSNAQNKDTGDTVSLPVILGMAIVIGSIGGIIGNMIFGALTRWTGSWLGGVATYDEARAAAAWGSVPNVVILALFLGLLGALGSDLFKSGGLEEMGNTKAIALLGVGLVQITMGIWAIVLTIKCLAEVHRFSAWKSLGSLLLAMLVILGIVLAIVLVVAGGIMAMKGGA